MVFDSLDLTRSLILNRRISIKVMGNLRKSKIKEEIKISPPTCFNLKIQLGLEGDQFRFFFSGRYTIFKKKLMSLLI